MREVFPKVKKGDRLTHGHVNDLSEVCRRLAGGTVGSYTNGMAGTINGQSGLVPFQQEVVRVTEVVDTTTYKIKIRYYDVDTDSWATGDHEYRLTTAATGGTFVVNDVVIAFYHQQSDFFIPLSVVSETVLRIGKAKGTINAGATNGVVVIWNKGTATTENEPNVYHDWMTNGQAIADGTEVVIGYFRDEGVWRVIGASCP